MPDPHLPPSRRSTGVRKVLERYTAVLPINRSQTDDPCACCEEFPFPGQGRLRRRMAVVGSVCRLVCPPGRSRVLRAAWRPCSPGPARRALVAHHQQARVAAAGAFVSSTQRLLGIAVCHSSRDRPRRARCHNGAVVRWRRPVDEPWQLGQRNGIGGHGGERSGRDRRRICPSMWRSCRAGRVWGPFVLRCRDVLGGRGVGGVNPGWSGGAGGGTAVSSPILIFRPG